MNHRDHLTPAQANLLDLFACHLMEIEYRVPSSPRDLKEAVFRHKWARIGLRALIIHEPIWLACDAPIEEWLGMITRFASGELVSSHNGPGAFNVRKGKR
jgi:hypothetical protein